MTAFVREQTAILQEVPVLRREFVARRTLAVHLEKPEGFRFTPGQFMDLTIPQLPERVEGGNRRHFTIASAPFERTLMIATRLRDSPFKETLLTMPLGTEIAVEGPRGSFTLHEDPARPAVFLAGGIGITPFRSIVQQAVRDRSPHSFFLFYANSGPEDAAFLEELQDLAARFPRLRLIVTMTDMAASRRPWTGERRRIGQDLIAEYVPPGLRRTYYVAGPPVLVADMQRLLRAAGVVSEDVRAESFTGY